MPLGLLHQLHHHHLLQVEPCDVGDGKEEKEGGEEAGLDADFCHNEEIFCVGHDPILSIPKKISEAK